MYMSFKTRIIFIVIFFVVFLSSSFAIAKNSKDIYQINGDQNHPNQTVIETKIKKEDAILSNPLGIVFYNPNYMMPYYYTWSPYQKIYNNETPDNQGIKRQEFKAQISFLVPIWHNILGYKNLDFNFAYTQLFYWQVYAQSQYFRETNYEPEAFLGIHMSPSTLLKLGVAHQSNGKGGSMERSWNRVYLDYNISGKRWLISVKPWLLIFKSRSSNLHNKDIAKYLGYERVVMSYKFKYSTVSLMVRNIEHVHRVTFLGDLTFPLTKHISGYLQFFSGYGQSLIEYNHRTNAVGIGISLSGWI